MHHFDRCQRIRLIRGKLCREVYAIGYTKEPFAVFREFEDGRKFTRNLYYRSIAGWMFVAPDEKVYGESAGRERWIEEAPKYDFCDDYLSPGDFDLIAEARPEFRWCLRKADDRGYTGADIFRLLRAFKEDSRVEFMVASGLKCLALSNGFRRLGKRLQQDVCRWAVQNGDYGLRAALDCLKNRIPIGEWHEWKFGAFRNLPYKSFRHLKDHNIYPGEYFEYLNTLREAGKDARDPYWGLPTDFRARRRTAERIVANIRKAQDAKRAEERKKEVEKLKKIAAKFIGSSFKGIKVWVPASYEEFSKQADNLDQCLISMDYIGKVASGECVLVFLAKGRKPIATAELLPKGKSWKVGQFYGDESQSDYLAGEKERAALIDWSKKNKLALKISA